MQAFASVFPLHSLPCSMQHHPYTGGSGNTYRMSMSTAKITVAAISKSTHNARQF